MDVGISFRNIYEHIEVPIFVIRVDAAGDFIFSEINPACEKATGLHKEDVVGKRPEEVPGFSAEDAAALRADFRHCLEGNVVIQHKRPLLGRNRGTRWLTRLAPMRDGMGKIVQIVGWSANITELKREEDVLRESEERYRALFEESIENVIITSHEGKLLDINRAGVKMFGYDTKEEMLRLDPAADIYEDPADRERVLSVVRERGSAEYEIRLRKKNGDVIHARCFNTAVRDSGGTIICYREIIRDITEVVETERNLRQSHDLLRAIIEAAPAAIIGLDLDGNVHTVWNPAAEKMLGWTAREVMGRPLPSVPMEKQEEFSKFREKIRRGEPLSGVEVRRQRRDGTPIDYSIYASPLHDADGRIIGNIAILVDITERKRTEEELRGSEERFRQLFDTAAVPLCFVSKEGVILDFNERFVQTFGYTHEDVPSLNEWWRLAYPDPDYRKWVVETWEKAVMRATKEQSDIEPVEHTVTCKNGEVRTMMISGTTLGDSFLATFFDLTDRKRAEEERLARLSFFESMDLINRAIQGTDDLERMMSDVLDAVLDIFDCDRAFLLYPCDPEAPSWTAPMERCRPEYPGVLALGLEMPMDEDVAETFRILLSSAAPVQFGPGTRYPLPADVSERFGFKSFMSTAIYPKAGKPWQFGIHQCSCARTWTAQEERLLQEIGRRITDALSSLLYQRDLREGETKYRRIVDTANEGIWMLGEDLTTVYVNARMAEMIGYRVDEIIGRPVTDFMFEEDTADHLDKMERRRRGISEDYERRYRRSDGQTVWTQVSAVPILDADRHFKGAFAMFTDITGRKRTDSIMQARLRLLELAGARSMDELLTATLDEIEALTGSSIGFYHFVGDDQRTLLLQYWSTNTLKNMCTAAGKGSHYDIRLAGVWVDCVYERGPVIHNDYASLPHRKGMPEGHAALVREVVVPVFRGNLIKAIVGVGNKPFEYDEGDVEIASQLGDLSWDIVERKHAAEALKRSEEEKTILNRIANVFLTVPDEAMYGEVLEVVLQAMKSPFGVFGYIGENGDLVIPSLTREVWGKCQVAGKSIVFPSDSWGNSLWGRSIREKKVFSSDGPFHAPEGHIHVDHFLTAPIVYGQETIGLIAVANKEEGYSGGDKDLLERIVQNVSPILHARLQRDSQERRRIGAERSLKESEEKYRLLITNADEAIFIIQDNVVKFPNPKVMEMSGYSAAELAELPFIDLIHPDDRDAVFRGRSALPERERRSEAYPFRIIDKNKGKEMWAQLTTVPIIWENKPGVLCFLRDVTEKKKLEAQFMQAQKMEAVGQLAGGVAHDFNNMLLVIIGYTELALRNVAPSDPLHVRLQQIDKAARRSADLTRQLLAFARRQAIAPQVLDLNGTVSGMLKMLLRLIGEEIHLAWIPGAELWPVKMDPSQIDQVLANLCVNARDAIAGMGRVTIETANIAFDEAYCAGHADSVPGDYVMLAVSDDGCGMDEYTREHLFEPFYTTKGMGLGTGLGLATVYGIVRQNNGFINVYSEPGQGTTFKIYFPRHKSQQPDTPAESAEETLPGGRETVLIVEDEKAVLDLGKMILEELGYSLLIARTPGEATRLAREYPGDIHLLITDVVMPEMNGRDLAKLLVSIKPGLKCLYMSGYTANIIADRGVLEEGVHFIQKPFSVHQLAVKVREALNRKPAGCDSE